MSAKACKVKICVCAAVVKTSKVGKDNAEAMNTLADAALIINNEAELSPIQETKLVEVFDALVASSNSQNQFEVAFKTGAISLLELSSEVFG